MHRIHENPWWRNPDWLNLAIAAAQFVLISVVAASVGWFLKERERQQEIVSLGAQLEEREPEKYRATAYALIRQGPAGIAELKSYTERVGCIPWQEARFLYSRLRSISQEAGNRQDAIGILWSSWVCNQDNLGVDVELYEAMQLDPQIACDVVLGKKLGLLEGSFFDRVALLAVIQSACAQRTSPELKTLEDKVNGEFESCFGGRGLSPTGEVVSKICLHFSVFLPWTPRIALFTGPFDATQDSWSTIVDRIEKIFSQRGTRGTAALSTALGSEPLFSRIIFGMLISMAGKPSKDESIRPDFRKSFEQWLDLALRSKGDPESKYAALAAIGNLDLKQYKAAVNALAETEPDTRIRERARAVTELL